MKFFIDLESNLPNFDMGKFMEFTDCYDPVTSAILEELKTLELGGVFTVQSEDGRPDLISYRIYGSTDYWWLLLYYNNIIDFNNIKTGDALKYPSVSSLESYYFKLKSKQSAS